QARTPPPRTAGLSWSVRPWLFRLEVAPDRREQVSMRLRVALALQDLRGAGDGEVGDLVAQGFPGPRHLLLDLGLRGGKDPVGFRLRLGLRRVDRLALELLALGNDLGAPALGLGHHVGDALLRVREALTTLLPCRDAVGDRLLARVDRAHERRPDELGGEPDE